MAAAILPTQPLVPQLVVEDLIVEVAPRMECAQSRAFKRIYSVLQTSVNAVAAACRDAANLPTVIDEERTRVAVAGPVCISAFELFVDNLELGR